MANNFLAATGFLRLYWTLNFELAINTIGLRLPAGVTISQALANSVGAQIKTAFTTNLAGLMNANTRLEKVALRDYRTAGMIEFRDGAAGVAGSEAAGQALPKQLAMCITLRTSGAGRSNRGRIYLGGFSETQNDANGAIVAGASTAGVAFVTAVKAAIEAGGMFMAVVSKPSDQYVVLRRHIRDGEVLEEDILSTTTQKAGHTTDVTVIEARNSNWETQRRRGNAKGGTVPALGLNPVAVQYF
jgi:hypothetical protein